MAMQLNAVLRRNPIASPRESSFWPIPNQYIGLEIETEGMPGSSMSLFESSRQSWWTTHQDASLRNNGVEFVLSNPTMGEDLDRAIDFFYSTFSRPWIASGRTSTHIHLNMQQEEDTTEVLRALVALYYALEPAFFASVSEDRKWSGYCNELDARGMECLTGLYTNGDAQIRNWYDSVNILSRTPGGRYYGFNIAALLKYGTIEFRHFPCATTRQQLVDYVFLVMEMKRAAQVIAEEYSSGASPEGCLAWFTKEANYRRALNFMPTWGDRLAANSSAQAFTTRAGKLAAHSALAQMRPGIRSDNPVVAKFLGTTPAKKSATRKKAQVDMEDTEESILTSATQQTDQPFRYSDPFNTAAVSRSTGRTVQFLYGDLATGQTVASTIPDEGPMQGELPDDEEVARRRAQIEEQVRATQQHWETIEQMSRRTRSPATAAPPPAAAVPPTTGRPSPVAPSPTGNYAWDELARVIRATPFRQPVAFVDPDDEY